jgi:hypothetical protein
MDKQRRQCTEATSRLDLGNRQIVKDVHVDCSVCWALKRTYEAAAGGYMEARSSACFRMSKGVAAWKIVEMERARCEFEEHRLVCVSAVKAVELLPK